MPSLSSVHSPLSSFDMNNRGICRACSRTDNRTDRSVVRIQVSDGSRDRTRDPFNSTLLV